MMEKETGNPLFSAALFARGKAMANYPQELAQDAMRQSYTSHMTGLWLLPARPLRLSTNEWMTCLKTVECRSTLWTVTPLTYWECWDSLFPSVLFVTQLMVLRCGSWWQLMEEGHEIVLRQDTESPGGYIFACSGWKCLYIYIYIKEKLWFFEFSIVDIIDLYLQVQLSDSPAHLI